MRNDPVNQQLSNSSGHRPPRKQALCALSWTSIQAASLRRSLIALGLLLIATPLLSGSENSHAENAAPEGLTTKEIMNAILTPMTATIWGAYELETSAEWLAVENAALSVVAAGSLLANSTGNGDSQEAQWQEYNGQMMAAARKVLEAVAARDEEALSSAGNDLLYPPCESCHQRYQQR